MIKQSFFFISFVCFIFIEVFREAEVATMLQQLQLRRNQGEPGG